MGKRCQDWAWSHEMMRGREAQSSHPADCFPSSSSSACQGVWETSETERRNSPNLKLKTCGRVTRQQPGLDGFSLCFSSPTSFAGAIDREVKVESESESKRNLTPTAASARPQDAVYITSVSLLLLDSRVPVSWLLNIPSSALRPPDGFRFLIRQLLHAPVVMFFAVLVLTQQQPFLRLHLNL